MAAPSDASYPAEAFVASYQNETAGEGHAGGPLLTPMETAVLVAGDTFRAAAVAQLEQWGVKKWDPH